MTRGRQSNARGKLAKVPDPPAFLGDYEAAVWTATCKAQNAEWLETGPGPLLENYCFAVVHMRNRRAAIRVEAASPDNKGRVSMSDLEELDTLSKMVERLSRALRLTPQTRQDRSAAKGQARQPWELTPEDDGDTA